MGSWKLGLDSILSFWVAYIMTRPLGASIGDFLSQEKMNGGLGLGATVTSIIFLSAIFVIVIFLTVTKKDKIANNLNAKLADIKKRYVWVQVIGTVVIFMIIGGCGYYLRINALQKADANAILPTLPLGDLSGFRRIAYETLNYIKLNNMSSASNSISALESEWDNAEARLRSINPNEWKLVDKLINNVLKNFRSVHQDKVACRVSLESLLQKFDTLDRREVKEG